MLPPTTWSEPGSLLPTPNSSPPFSTDTPSFSISHPHVPPVREINLTRPHHLNHLSVPQGSPKLIDRPRATTSVSPAPRKQRSPRSGGATKGLSTSAWEDEGTNVYQLEVNDVLLTRRMDNDRINGTKLLNIAALTRGRRDGILKNERPREVIKHGAMHLKGVWIELERARALAYTHNIYPLVAMILSDTPDEHLYDPEASASLGATRWNPRGDASSSTDDEASSTGGCSTDLRDLPVNPYGDWRV
ncbi:transcription regulator HTH, apses-type DNA-binding domain-containing protein [Cladochytrium replicatum]|nr:transcription regulator HTH, apses-type DNA-binding domain-containing protein [Cladochytrium replicatum]